MKIEDVLWQLGAKPTMKGTLYLLDSHRLIAAEPQLLYATRAQLYPAIAALHPGANANNVEAAIRRCIVSCWLYGNRTFMEKIMHEELPGPPSNGQFIGMLAVYTIPQLMEIM